MNSLPSGKRSRQFARKNFPRTVIGVTASAAWRDVANVSRQLAYLATSGQLAGILASAVSSRLIRKLLIV